MTATGTYQKTVTSQNGKAVRKQKARKSAKAKTPSQPARAKDDGSHHDATRVERCLKGDESAWEEVYDLCQPQLMLAVRNLIGKNGHGENLAEEITARVWLSLVGSEGRLLARFDAHRGNRLTTYLASLARHELLKYWRGEQRRTNRERTALRNRATSQMIGVDQTKLYWHEFLQTLTEREKEFVEQALTGSNEGVAGGDFTSANTWQLRRRVTSKVKRYFNQ